MALNTQSLARICATPYAAGESKSIYHYCTADTVAACIASGYFNGATKILRKGDMIMIAAVLDGTPTTSHAIVTSATGAATVTTAVAIFA